MDMVIKSSRSFKFPRHGDEDGKKDTTGLTGSISLTSVIHKLNWSNHKSIRQKSQVSAVFPNSILQSISLPSTHINAAPNNISFVRLENINVSCMEEPYGRIRESIFSQVGDKSPVHLSSFMGNVSLVSPSYCSEEGNKHYTLEGLEIDQLIPLFVSSTNSLLSFTRSNMHLFNLPTTLGNTLICHVLNYNPHSLLFLPTDTSHSPISSVFPYQFRKKNL